MKKAKLSKSWKCRHCGAKDHLGIDCPREGRFGATMPDPKKKKSEAIDTAILRQMRGLPLTDLVDSLLEDTSDD